MTDEGRELLIAWLKTYLELINSGDCGHWDPESEPLVIATRNYLERTS